jgi:hypothetical protein
MTVMGLIRCNLYPLTSFNLQGIQYGYSLGSLGLNWGLIVNLHSLHESSRLSAVKVTLIATIPATESIL